MPSAWACDFAMQINVNAKLRRKNKVVSLFSLFIVSPKRRIYLSKLVESLFNDFLFFLCYLAVAKKGFLNFNAYEMAILLSV
jgi:hypothetical protein